MTMKYWRLTVKGERPADEIQSTVGQMGGSVLRIHFEGGETQVYFAADLAGQGMAQEVKESATTMEEVIVDEVTNFSPGTARGR